MNDIIKTAWHLLLCILKPFYQHFFSHLIPTFIYIELNLSLSLSLSLSHFTYITHKLKTL